MSDQASLAPHTEPVLPTPARARGRALWELLSSMRFAIALLTVICIASVIGTVLKQGEPLNNYVNQFGPFWAEVFGAIGLYHVYSAPWFLLILAFLVLSTSLCIARNTPKILADLKTYKENLREQSLKAFGQHASGGLPQAPGDEAQRIGAQLVKRGWKVKLQRRDTAQGDGWMVAAKVGSANKIGYLAAHSAIVLICLGGLLDGDLIVRAQMWLGGKSLYSGGGMISDVKPEHRLPVSNPTFRGNLLVPEGARAGTAILSQPGGVLLQDLPFEVELKKFIVEHYSTGMPKLFASEIVIHDRETGATQEARVEVNHPANYKGVEIYQSSFDDGGSAVQLLARPVAGGKPFEVRSTIGASVPLTRVSQNQETAALTLELTGLRVINVENLGEGLGKNASGADVRKVDLGEAFRARLGAANKTGGEKKLRNVGPSITYKLRDGAGQAKEFHHYMLPVDMGDGPVFLLGARDTPAESFRYLRIPADEQGGLDGFMRLNDALHDPDMRKTAVQRYVAGALDGARPELSEALRASSARALDLFAGAVPDAKGKSGLQAISDFMEANVPEAERERAGTVLIRILNGVLFELAQLSRQNAGLKPLAPDEKTQAIMTQSVMALSDLPFYPAPLLFELKDFKQVQASVFQVARAPGKTVVYLGCALLILGVFAMLYIRERRLWVWLAPRAAGGTDATMALSSNRKTLDGEREYSRLKALVLREAPSITTP